MKLKPQQVDALAYAKDRDEIALFMEMRMGKTSAAIKWVQARGYARVLLVAPLSILPGRLGWVGALNEHSVVPHALFGLPPEDRVARAEWQWGRSSDGPGLVRRRPQGWFLIGHDAVRAEPRVLDLPWDCIIVDESTIIRNPKADITKLLLTSTGHIRGRAILSGLPNPEHELDVVCQFLFLQGTYLGFAGGVEAFWKFRHACWQPGAFEYDWVPKAGVRKRMKEHLHREAFVATRKQYNVGSPKVREQRTVPMNRAQQKALREIEKDFAYADTETKWAPVVHAWMQRVAGGFTPLEPHELINDAKLRLLADLLTQDYRREPVVVWFRFNAEIDAALRWLRKYAPKRRVGIAYGECTLTERATVQEQFHSGKLDTLLIQASLGKFGWNLSPADVAIYYSNTYDHEVRSQSEDRIIHIDKTHPVTILDLVTEGSPDEDVVEAICDKRLNAQSLLARRIAMRVEQFTARVRASRGRQERLF